MNTNENINETFFDDAFATPQFPGNDEEADEMAGHLNIGEDEESDHYEMVRARDLGEREDQFRDDVEADADALSSCGWGTDEDYGGCNDMGDY